MATEINWQAIAEGTLSREDYSDDLRFSVAVSWVALELCNAYNDGRVEGIHSLATRLHEQDAAE